MTKQQQCMFVKELTTSVTKELLEDIKTCKVPANWGGIELRQLLADRYARAVFGGILVRSRKAAYNRAIIDNNL